MKKITLWVLCTLILFLSSCAGQDVSCDENETLVDGVCEVIKTPFEQTFDRMKDLNNYTLDVTIQQLADLYTFTMKVDDNKASFTMDGNEEFYEYSDQSCLYYYPVGDGYRMETIPCESTSITYDFFHSFEPSWFTEVSGKYFLKSDFYDEASLLFQTEIEGSSVANLELIVNETYFDQLIFDVFVGDVSYRFEMTFDHVESTVITLPTV